MDSESCVFCEIAKENPSPSSAEVFFANEHVLSFLDIQPLVTSRAHVLVVPRKHYETLDALAEDAETSKALGLWLPRIAKAALEVTGGQAFNIIQNNGPRAGQVVPHVHFHIVVRDPTDSVGSKVTQIVQQEKEKLKLRDRVQFNANVFARGTREALTSTSLADKLRAKL